jgi:hypothetical protein
VLGVHPARRRRARHVRLSRGAGGVATVVILPIGKFASLCETYGNVDWPSAVHGLTR